MHPGTRVGAGCSVVTSICHTYVILDPKDPKVRLTWQPLVIPAVRKQGQDPQGKLGS